MKYIVNLEELYLSEDGNCFFKCLQSVYRYYGIDITTSDLLVMSDCYSMLCNKSEYGNISIYVDLKKLESMPLKVNRVQCDSIEFGIEEIEYEIKNNNIVLLLVNTYFLEYTDDYLKNSGGYFGGGHALLIKGFDNEKHKFIVYDPTYRINEYLIDYDKMKLAWTYVEGTKNFKPRIMYTFERLNEENFDLNKFINNSFINNMRTYYRTIKNNTSDIYKWLNDYKYAVDTFNIKILNNIAKSIFHEIRWARKSMYLFLKNRKNIIKYLDNKQINYFKEFYEEWTQIYNILSMGLLKNTESRVIKSYIKAEKLLKREKAIIENMLLKFDKNKNF